MNYYLAVLKKYAIFNGRARRAEYWYFTLFNLIISVALGVVNGIVFFTTGISIIVLCWIYVLAVVIPSLAVAVRRLHDTGRSGWWMLISLIPFIGGIVLLVFFVQDSQPGENQYGSNPKEITSI
ncbi:MAG TPA: DUF805 domain-containing protein [Candidatus Campbellbacteria bacterium]|nr:DUF805 domain-containing protein [Candidatus Campbellbacteria bacterium]